MEIQYHHVHSFSKIFPVVDFNTIPATRIYLEKKKHRKAQKSTKKHKKTEKKSGRNLINFFPVMHVNY
jgi:hypothetical protein